MFAISKKTMWLVASGIILIIIAIVLTYINFQHSGLKLKVGEPVALITSGVSFPTLSSDQLSIYYFDKNGRQFKRYEVSSRRAIVISRAKIDTNIDALWWSPDKQKVIYQTSKKDGDENYIIKNYLLNLKDSSSKELPMTDLQALAWREDSQQFVYASSSPDNADDLALSSMSVDANDALSLATVPSYGAPVKLFWTSKIYLFKSFDNPPESDLTSAEQEAKFYSLAPDKATMPSSLNVIPNLVDLSFLPNEKQFISQIADTDNGFLITKDGNAHALELNLLSLSSIVLSNDAQAIYAFVRSNPASPETDLYKISMANFKADKVAALSNQENNFFDNLLIYKTEDLIFYTNQETLYGLRIK